MYTHYDLMLPLLKIMQANDRVYSLQEAYKELIQALKCSEKQANATMEDGRNIIFYRLQWAKTYLKKADLLEYPKKAHFQLSKTGKNLDLRNIELINAKYLSQFGSFSDFRKLNSKTDKETKVSVIKEESLVEELTPPEIIAEQAQILKDDLKSELLGLVKNNSPRFFERLVVDLLVAMGYGGSHQDAAQAIGRTNDGGIDGVISEDRLGLDKIYIQAKRWEDTVGRPHIQQFKGALADQVAKKAYLLLRQVLAKKQSNLRKSRESC